MNLSLEELEGICQIPKLGDTLLPLTTWQSSARIVHGVPRVYGLLFSHDEKEASEHRVPQF